MKNLVASLLMVGFISFYCESFSQSVGIGTNSPNASAQLDINSSSKGILIPRLTTTQRNGIAAPANGLMIYNSTTKQYNFYNGTMWQTVSGIPKGGILLGENNYDSAFIKEGFLPDGFLTQDYTRLQFGDTILAANNWHLGNIGDYQNESAPTNNNIAWFNGTELFVFQRVSSASTSSGSLVVAVNIYNPATDKWTIKQVIDASVAGILVDVIYNGTIVWTGSEFLLWGGGRVPYNCGAGFCSYSYLSNKGLKYNPATNVWTTMPVTNAPVARYYHKAVWTGTEMIVWGGKDRLQDSLHSFQNTGGKYNPTTNTWTPLSIPPSFAGRQDFTMTYIGSNKVIIWGGKAVEPKTRTITLQCASGPLSVYYYDSIRNYSDGIIYNTINNTWTTMNNSGAPSARYAATAEWYVDRLIIAGGTNTSHTFGCGSCTGAIGFPVPCAKAIYIDSILKTGAQYSPATNVWSPIPDAPRAFTGLSSFFDNEQYIWIYGSDSTMLYEPSADDWLLLSQNPLPVFSNPLQRQLAWQGNIINNGIAEKIALPGVEHPFGKAAVYNYRVIPITLPDVKSTSTQATRFYLYKKD